MNFLELCQRTERECGVASQLTTTINQSGNHKLIVDWVNDAWNDIQTIHQDWEWLRQSTSFVTVDGQAAYTPIQCGIASGFGLWARDTFRCYNTVAGINSEIPMHYVSYEYWRDTYQLGAQRDMRGQPVCISITPSKSIALGSTPSAGYTITGDYYKAPVVLAADADIPEMPSQFHMAIVWKACMSYGAFEAAPEVFQRGEVEFGKLKRRLERDRMPEMQFAGALA